MKTLREMDYSILQQCMHCGMCLPTCPTYSKTKLERHGPRGRIALMRAIADGKMELTREFGEEMNYCLGCLACQTACPAGVQYGELFEVARNEVEASKVISTPFRKIVRPLTMGWLFQDQRRLRCLGYLIWMYQVSGMQSLFRWLRLPKLLPSWMRDLEPQTPVVLTPFSPGRIKLRETPPQKKYRVGFLTGCVQDLLFSDINRDTVDVLLANQCEVVTPRVQGCCGSLHAHNGDMENAKKAGRTLMDQFDLESLDAIISNAGGCGSHLKHYDHLFHDDPVYASKAKLWTQKLKDIHEWLVEIQFRTPSSRPVPMKVTYHESCHLTHGQKIVQPPRQILKAIPGLELIELPESNWCCGSAGIYNIVHPETGNWLLDRKMKNVETTRAEIIASANPGCTLHLRNGCHREGMSHVEVLHPISILARAYRSER